MKTMKKIIGFIVLSLSLTVPTAFTLTKPIQTPVMTSLKTILASPAAQKAFGHTRSHIYKKLSEKKALGPFVTFALNNGPIFAKWPTICSDFVEELTQTMPVEEILSNLGINKATLTPSETPLPHVDSAEENKAKDTVITALLKNSKLNALASLLSIAVGYVSNLVYSRKPAVENPESTTETLMQAALRTALKKNLSLAQLKSLQGFSDTTAFGVLVDNFDYFKTIFIEMLVDEDPSIVETLSEHLTTMSMNSTPANSPCTDTDYSQSYRVVETSTPIRAY